jgi:hypothetical protein
LLLLGAGVGQGATQSSRRWSVVAVVFPLAQGAFGEAKSPGGFGTVVTALGQGAGEVDRPLAHAALVSAACSIFGVIHHGPHHAQVILDEVVAE